MLAGRLRGGYQIFCCQANTLPAREAQRKIKQTNDRITASAIESLLDNDLITNYMELLVRRGERVLAMCLRPPKSSRVKVL